MQSEAPYLRKSAHSHDAKYSIPPCLVPTHYTRTLIPVLLPAKQDIISGRIAVCEPPAHGDILVVHRCLS